MLIEYCSKVPESSYCLFWVVFAACLSLVNTWIKTRWDGPGRQSALLCMIIGGKRVRSCNWFVLSSRKTKRFYLLPLEKPSIDHFTVACCIACCFFFFFLHFPAFLMLMLLFWCQLVGIYVRKAARFLSKQGQHQAHFHSKVRQLSTTVNCKTVTVKLAVCGDGELL